MPDNPNHADDAMMRTAAHLFGGRRAMAEQAEIGVGESTVRGWCDGTRPVSDSVKADVAKALRRRAHDNLTLADRLYPVSATVR